MLDPASVIAAVARRHVQRLELLDRVRLDADAHTLPHDLEEVDENPAAEQVVDLVLPRAVLAHQPPERGALVGGVVVDVQIGDRRDAARR